MTPENRSKFEREAADPKYGDAAHAYCGGEFEDAAIQFQHLAASGNSMAATYLAEMYLRGEGVPKSIETGIQWLENAVSWGNSGAAYNLGALYRAGHDGAPKDDEKSKHFFRLAKDLGCDAVDQYLLE